MVIIEKVRKRDGRLVVFDKQKIEQAIFKAITATNQGDGEKSKKLADRVVGLLIKRLKPGEIPEIEQIQDTVEEVLMLEGLTETAKAFILYREQKRKIREIEIAEEEAALRVDQYLEEIDWEVKENANMAYSLQGLNNYITSTLIKRYWLEKIYPEEIREAVVSGDFHIHDLQTLGAYCCGWDLYDLLLKGFGGVNGKIQAGPVKHFRTALGQIVNFLYTLQGEIAGAIAFSNFDTLLAPFVRYDNLSSAQVKQAIQEFMFNANVPTRVGFQSLARDELVVIKNNGRIDFVEIGCLVDQEFTENSHRVLEDNPGSYAVENHKDCQTLSFNEKGEAVWAEVKAFIRHRVPKDSRFIRLQTSRGEAKVSPAHSLFRFEELNKEFKPKPVSAAGVKTDNDYRHLKNDNHFLALNRLKNSGQKQELDLVEILEQMPALYRQVMVKINPSKTLAGIRKNVFEEFKSFTPFYKEFGIKNRGIWKCWLKNESIRYDVWRKYGNLQKEVSFKLKNSEIWHPRYLKGKVLEDFVRLCAWYISEGHSALSTPLFVSQAASKPTAIEIREILKNLNVLGEISKNYGFSSKTGKKNQTKILKITGRGLLCEIISRSSGFLAFEKQIPWFIFKLKPRFQKVFIKTLLQGDGSEYPQHWDFTTTSRKLSLSLAFILAQNSFRFSVYTDKTSQKNSYWRDQLIIRVFKENSSKYQYRVGDFEARICLKKEVIPYQEEFEYDLAVDITCENFVGGTGLLVFHNTPFENLTLDIKPSPVFAKQPVIIGGKPQKETYGEFQEEMDMINRALFEVILEGDAQGRVFSVDSGCFCPIKNSERIKLIKIGEYIDEWMEKRKPTFIRTNNCEILDVKDLDLKCLGLKRGVIDWQKINFLVRHPTGLVLKIFATAGFNIKVTPSHSVLVLRDGDIKEFEAKNLKRGDYLIAPKTIPQGENRVSEISLAKEFVRKGKEKGIFISNVFKGGKIYQEERVRTHKRDYGKRTYGQFYGVSVFPLTNISKRLEGFNLSRAKLSLAGSKIKISDYLPVSRELIEFLGWYCAEGSAEINNKYGGISLAFNLKKEKETVRRLGRVIKKIWPNVPVKFRDIKKRNLTEIRIHSKLVRRIITEIFEIKNKSEKKVPQIVFELSPEMKKVFLEAYFKGDAYIKDGNFVATSISRELIYGISTLLKQLEIFHTLTEYSYKGKVRWRVNLWRNKELKPKKSNSISKIPIRETGLERIVEQIAEKELYYYDSLGRKYRNSKNRIFDKFGVYFSSSSSTSLDRVRKIMDYARKLKVGTTPALERIERDNLLFLKVKKIEKTRPSNGMVYDFSTESENFVADQLLVHNTFPIPTINITKDFPWEKEELKPMWEATAKYGVNYFGNYINSEMEPEDVRSMCPLAGDEKILIKSSRGRGLEYIDIKGAAESIKGRHEIYSDGKFIGGHFNKFTNQEMIRVVLENGHKIKMSKNHLNFVKSGPRSITKELKGEELTPGMYLPYSLNVYKGEGGNEDLGYFVGAFAGDGSLVGETSVIFSLENERKKEVINKLINIAEKYFGAHYSTRKDPKTKLFSLRINSRAAAGLCRDFVRGKEREKSYRARVFGTSIQFRQGVILGHYATDGGNRHRIYTSSKKMMESLNMLAATLGTTTSIYEDRREGRLGKEPNYAVLIYQLNRKNYGEFWFKEKDRLWMKIKKIDEIQGRTAYCFEVDKGEPVFTIGTTGILTHNCRLRLDTKELYNRGGGGLFGAGSLTGSIGVVTINLARIGYLAKSQKEFLEKLGEIMDLAKESLEIKRKAVEKLTDKGLYPYCRYWLGGIKKMRGQYWGNHFSTIGLIGANEACLNLLGKDIGTKTGREFGLVVLDFMREKLVQYQERTGNLYNLEATPAEGSLAPDEKVLISQSDPKLTEIGPLIDGYLTANKERVQMVGNSEVLPISRGELSVYGFGRKDQKVKKYPVTALIRHPGASMCEIITASGRKVKITQQHSVFSLNEKGLPQETRVSDLKIGDSIAIPKKIEMENKYFEFNLIEEFKKHPQFKSRLYLKTQRDLVEKLISDSRIQPWAEGYYASGWKDIKHRWKQKGVVPLKMLYDLNISLERKALDDSFIFYRKSKNTSPVKIFIKGDGDLGFILGSLLAEGWLNTDRIEFTNTNEGYIKEMSAALQNVFGKKTCHLSVGSRRRGRKKRFVLVLNKMTSLVIREIFGFKGKSVDKSIPPFVYFTSDDFVAGLLRGFSLGDGSEDSNPQRSNYTFRLYTNSKSLLEGLNLLFLKLGILTKIRVDKKDEYNRHWKKNYVLLISGTQNLKRFYSLIFKREFNKGFTNSGRERIPGVARPLRDLLRKHHLDTKSLRALNIHKDSFNRNARKNMISQHYLKELLEKLEKKIKDPLLENLKVLIRGDLYWDSIKSIRKVEVPKNVYDFEVDAKEDLVENFLGGEGLVCLHNTSYRLALKDKEKYPEIITAGSKEIPYYSNSTQLPVHYNDDVFEALELQDQLQSKYTGGCIEKGNNVLTNKGLIKIEDIFKDFENMKPIKALSYNKEKGISEWDEITKAVKIDVKKYNKIRIKGERNLDITTSDWHPFFVLKKFKPNPACPICKEKVRNLKAFATHIKWNPECGEKYQDFDKYQVVEKRADELKIGDYILQNSCNLYPVKKSDLDNNLMWLIGFFIGVGCISEFIDNRGGNSLKKYKIRFFSSHLGALEKTRSILKRHFRITAKVIHNSSKSKVLKELGTSQRSVSEFFLGYGFSVGKKVYDICLPQKVKENITKENVFSLLSGLADSDGHIATRDGVFEYQTVSLRLAEDILEVCTTAGIMVSKSLKKAKRDNEVDIYRLKIPSYQLVLLRDKLSIVVNSSRIKTKLSNRRKRYLPAVRVKSISKINVEDNQFYDLMTEKNHNYLAGKHCLVFIHNTVFHIFLGERLADGETAKKLIRTIFEKFKLPYVSLTPTFSICPFHGYLAGEHFECPKCTIKQPCEVYSRIVGYYRPVGQWNVGKQTEYHQRRTFKLDKK